jgi:hypothetical protein
LNPTLNQFNTEQPFSNISFPQFSQWPVP